MKVPDTKQERRRFIKEHLSQYQDKSFYCRALDCNVKVTDKSIEETAFQAAISKQATKLAIQLPQVIRNASILEWQSNCRLYQKRRMHRIRHNGICCHKIRKMITDYFAQSVFRRLPFYPAKIQFFFNLMV